VTTDPADATDAEPQAVLAPLTHAAIFLVAVVRPDDNSVGVVRDVCGDLAALVRGVGTRHPDAYLTCVTGIGDRLWDTLAGEPRPAGLHPFQEIEAPGRHAVSTPGDLLFHIRAARMDLCYELATQLMYRLGGAVRVVDEVHGFRYFDSRDVIGFVDGTENPAGSLAAEATLIGAEDPAFAGGSYVIVQKYLHDMAGWNALPTEQQEGIIGRQKLSDIELTDDVKPSFAHNALTVITDADGAEIKILRDNMAFGSPGSGEHGTYFIGYAKSPEPTEQMMRNMFIGSPEGNYDRLLDFSRAVTGTLFFVPSQPLLESLADGPLNAADAEEPGASGPEAAEPDTTGPDTTRPDTTGPDKARPDTAGPDTAAPDMPGPADVPWAPARSGGPGGTGSLEIGSMKGASPDE
jgi:putative iron-dependent peroxidase